MASKKKGGLGDRHRWDETAARKALRLWRESGLSGAKFAAKHGFNPQRLFWWKKRLEGSARAVEEQPLRLVPAEVVGVSGSAVVVRGPGGVVIEVDAKAVSPRWVSALVHELAKG